MIARLNEKGKLTVTPQSEVESYALRAWFKDYSKMEIGSGGETVPARGREAILEIVVLWEHKVE